MTKHQTKERRDECVECGQPVDNGDRCRHCERVRRNRSETRHNAEVARWIDGAMFGITDEDY